MRHFSFALLASVMLVGIAPAQSVILSDVHSGHTYYVLSNSNWTDAEAKAVSLGGHLVTINDAAENAYLERLSVASANLPRDLWTGLHLDDATGNLAWSSGEAVTYTNLYIAQPDPSRPYYFWYYNDGNYGHRWVPNADTPSWPFGTSNNLFGVVEVESVPEPASLTALGLGILALLRRRKR